MHAFLYIWIVSLPIQEARYKSLSLPELFVIKRFDFGHAGGLNDVQVIFAPFTLNLNDLGFPLFKKDNSFHGLPPPGLFEAGRIVQGVFGEPSTVRFYP